MVHLKGCNWIKLLICISLVSRLVYDIPAPVLSLFSVLKVGMGTNKTLYALEDGCVRFTKEVYVPPPRSLEASTIIPKLPKGAVLYKTFINVMPVKQEGKFRLVDLV